VIEIKRFSGCNNFFASLTKNGQICEIDLGSIADQGTEPRETRDGAAKALILDVQKTRNTRNERKLML